MEVKEPVQLVEKKKQDIYVSDSFGFAKATLWEENIGKKELGKSYFLEAYVLRVYQSAKYVPVRRRVFVLKYLRHCFTSWQDIIFTQQPRWLFLG